MKVKVTIIVPVYNVENYITECIESLVKQTLTDIEIILINDGSKDNSGIICEKFAEKYSFIHLINKINEGVSVARNEGIKVAQGEYITFVDGDDYIDNSFCENFYKMAIKNKADICVCDYKYIGSKGNVEESRFTLSDATDIENYKKELILRTLYRGYGGNIKNSVVSAGVTWGKFYRLNFIKENNIEFVPNLIRAQDTVFWLNLLVKTDKIAYINKALYTYRINAFSITSGSKYIKNSIEKFGKLLKEYEIFINNNCVSNEFTQAFYGRIIEVIFWHIKHNYLNENNKSNYKIKKKEFENLLKSAPYNEALKKININILNRHEKIFVFCAKKHLGWQYVNMYEKYRLRKRK